MSAITRLKEDRISIYMCTFQLQLSRLDMLLKFPCSFFVQWKTSNNTKCVRTCKVYQAMKNHVVFDQSISLQTEMVYDEERKKWIRKNTVICVNVITKSKPDQNKQAGRICIDLVDIIQNKKHQKLSVQPLTYCSINGNLTFSINLKYSLRVQIEPSKLDLNSFADFVSIQQSVLNKSKSLDFLKKRKFQVLQRIQSVGEIQQNERQEKQRLEIIQKKTSLKDFSKVKQCQEYEQEDNLIEHNIRMTIGSEQQATRLDYNLLIQKQTAGMKKSDLMVVPNISTPRSRVQNNQSCGTSQFSESQSNNEKVIDKGHYKTNENFASQEIMNSVKSKPTLQRLDSVVDIAYDEQSLPSYPSINRKFMNMKSSVISDKSASIKNYKVQRQSPNKQEELQNRNNQIKQLKSDMSELVKLITNVNQQLSGKIVKTQQLEASLELQKKKYNQLQQKLVFQQKINTMNLQKIKELNQKIDKYQSQKQNYKKRLSNVEELRIMSELQEYKTKCKKLDKNFEQLKLKINKRDQIELENEQKIMMLNEQIQKLKAQVKENSQDKNRLNQSPVSVKTRAHVIKLQTKLQNLQKQSQNMYQKGQLYKKMIHQFMERQKRMIGNISIMQEEFVRLAKQYNHLSINKTDQLPQKSQNLSKHSRTDSKQKEMTFSHVEIKIILKLKQLIRAKVSQKIIKSDIDFQFPRASQQFKSWVLKSVQELNSYVEQFVNKSNKAKEQLVSKVQQIQSQLRRVKEKNKQLFQQLNSQKKSQSQGSAFYPQYSSNLQNLSPQIQKIQLYSQTTTKKPNALSNVKKGNQNQPQRQIQKLKSIIYDKSKEMSDLTASYQKVKLQNQKQSVAIKNLRQQINFLSNDSQKKKLLQTLQVQNQRQEQFVHNILDLQIKLHKEKLYNSQIQSQLSVRKSLNRSQQISQNKDNHCNSAIQGLAVYKQIHTLLKQRTQTGFQKDLHLLIQNQNVVLEKFESIEKGCQINYIFQEKARNISKQLQKVKSSLIKMKTTELQNKSHLANILKPCQNAVADLLTSIQNRVNHPTD